MEVDSTFFIGLAECLGATFLYGTAFVPLRQSDFRDGVYSLQIRSIAVLTLGVFCSLLLPEFFFYPLAMVGGVVWVIANLIILPCINELGLAVAVLLYSVVNCLANWSTGHFGWFGTKARPPKTYWLNYLGLVLLVFGGILISFIKPTPRSSARVAPTTIETPEKETRDIVIGSSSGSPFPSSASSMGHFSDDSRIPGCIQRFWNGLSWRATGFALLSGFFYGENVTPIVYVQDHPEIYPNAPQDGFSYIFSHYLGVFCSASVIFFVYTIIKKGQPFVTPELTLPSFISGIIWGIAQTLFIMSTKNLSQSFCGPISAIFCGCVASCYSVFYFKEIQSLKGIIFLVASIISTVAGAICLAVSKTVEL